ncbi:MAG: N-6 DNA methylase [Planctomycetota bacterium]|nr:N-6 DNA methylase [Planctomycetota bacterium]
MGGFPGFDPSAQAEPEAASSVIPLSADTFARAARRASPGRPASEAPSGSRAILRPTFGPLRLARRISAILEDAPRAEVSAWVSAAAAARVERAGAPARWVEELAGAFPLTLQADRKREACARALASQLPDAAWREDALLGELLLAARARAFRPERTGRAGRAGRVSAPNVYTPPELARRIVGGLMVGPRRVVDPACGAGVFLVAAFERALERRKESGQAPLEAARAALAHEICGIDTDAQALALARFNLRMAAWEFAGLGDDVSLDLHCADALGEIPGLDGRADLVVGNPPFVEGRGLSDRRLAGLRRRFRTAAEGKVNLFAVFVERGLALLREGGVLSFVLPATFQRNERYRALREFLLEYTLESIEPVDAHAFEGRIVETVILRVRKQPPARRSRVELPAGPCLQARLPLGPGLRFGGGHAPAMRRQIEAMEGAGVPLANLFDVRDGISTGFQPFPKRLLGHVDGHVFVAEDGTRATFDPQKHVRVIDGGEFASCSPVRWEGRWIEYDKTHEHVPPHPGKPFNCQLRERAIFDRGEKLISRQTARGLVATLDRERFFVRNTVHVTYPRPGAPVSLAALCACFASSFYERYFLAVTGEDGKVFPQVHIADLKRLPVPANGLAPDGTLHGLGEDLLALHRPGQDAGRLAQVKDDVERTIQALFGL